MLQNTLSTYQDVTVRLLLPEGVVLTWVGAVLASVHDRVKVMQPACMQDLFQARPTSHQAEAYSSY